MVGFGESEKEKKRKEIYPKKRLPIAVQESNKSDQ